MDAQRVANAMDRFSQLISDLADELRDDVAVPAAAPIGVGREVDYDGDTAEDTILQVPAGDLWRLVNRSRKMIRLAREGKIPDMNGRAPLRDAIRALKAQGLVRKPHNLHD